MPVVMSGHFLPVLEGQIYWKNLMPLFSRLVYLLFKYSIFSEEDLFDFWGPAPLVNPPVVVVSIEKNFFTHCMEIWYGGYLK